MTKSALTIGWSVDNAKHPSFWRKKTAKAGEQDDPDLVTVPAAAIAHHTAIIAQSGSGKSFFLGRIIEEIMLRTKARCMILDPNRDFRKISEVKDDTLWTNAKYDPAKLLGLPHEKSKAEFDGAWRKVSIRITTADQAGLKGDLSHPLKIPLRSLSTDFFAEELDPKHGSHLYLCQQVVSQLADLYAARDAKKTGRGPVNLIEQFQFLLETCKNPRYGRSAFDKEFPLPERKHEKGEGVSWQQDTFLTSAIRLFSVGFDFRGYFERTRDTVFDGLQRLATDASPDVIQYYLSKVTVLHSLRLLDLEIKKREQEPPPDLEVVDLPSLSHRDSLLLAVDFMLSSRWEWAKREWVEALGKDAMEDSRVPTFIVVDEAHNLIVRDPRSQAEKALRERFRTIAAEGRKFGLFLILVSQNPAKLDRFVLSECENRAMMRLNSDSVLKIVQEDLGLEGIDRLKECVRMAKGRALLVGPWSPEPAFLFCAARRTMEGGRDLRDDAWAVDPARPDPATSEQPLGPKQPPKSGDSELANARLPPSNNQPAKPVGQTKQPPSAG